MSRRIASCAIAFDMDGVFWKGSNTFDFANRALTKVISKKIPFVFVTNAAGEHPQSLKSASKRLGLEFDESQLILAHTPLKQYLYPKYENDLVLVTGRRDIYNVGLHFGLKRCVSVGEVLSQHPNLWPFPSIHKNVPLSDDRKLNEDIINFETRNVSAIAILDDGDCWGSEMQVILNCLLSAVNNGKDGNDHIPIYFVNQNTVWKPSPFPKFGLGMFGELIDFAYERMSGKPLSNVVNVGKPTLITYEYAKDILGQQAIKNGFSDGLVEEYYMIGDNPGSDIGGAHNIGWKSILVETGSYKKGMDDNNPTIIVDNVESAIDWICTNHELN